MRIAAAMTKSAATVVATEKITIATRIVVITTATRIVVITSSNSSSDLWITHA